MRVFVLLLVLSSLFYWDNWQPPSGPWVSLLSGWNPQNGGVDRVLQRSLDPGLQVLILKSVGGNGSLACRGWRLKVQDQSGRVLLERSWLTRKPDCWTFEDEKPGLWYRRCGATYQFLGYQEVHGLPEEFGEKEVGYWTCLLGQAWRPCDRWGR